MKRFLNLIVYILTIHVSALLIAGLFRLVLFISSYHQLTSEAFRIRHFRCLLLCMVSGLTM